MTTHLLELYEARPTRASGVSKLKLRSKTDPTAHCTLHACTSAAAGWLLKHLRCGHAAYCPASPPPGPGLPQRASRPWRTRGW